MTYLRRRITHFFSTFSIYNFLLLAFGLLFYRRVSFYFLGKAY